MSHNTNMQNDSRRLRESTDSPASAPPRKVARTAQGNLHSGLNTIQGSPTPSNAALWDGFDTPIAGLNQAEIWTPSGPARTRSPPADVFGSGGINPLSFAKKQAISPKPALTHKTGAPAAPPPTQNQSSSGPLPTTQTQVAPALPPTIQVSKLTPTPTAPPSDPSTIIPNDAEKTTEEIIVAEDIDYNQDTLLEAIAALGKEAEDDEDLDDFPTYIEFEQVTIQGSEPGAPAEVATGSRKKQPDPKLVLIPHQGLEAPMVHRSGYSFDFMPDKTLAECNKAKAGEPHALGKMTTMVLVNKSYRLLAKVVHLKCSKVKQSERIKFQTRAALVQLGLSPNDALAVLDMNKNAFDWFVVSLTKRALKALTPFAAIFDPKSRVLLILRPYDLKTRLTQQIRFAGVITEDEASQEAKTAIVATFQNQLNSELVKQNSTLAALEIQNDSNGVEHVVATFTFAAGAEKQITPKKFTPHFIVNGAIRRIIPKWPRRCLMCASEAHVSSKTNHCPWMLRNFGGVQADLWSATNLNPGQAYAPPKQKRAIEEVDTDSFFLDARPKAKKQKTTSEDSDMS
ncbi:hypothetical protein M408DRAFT_9144 [Serendipita vermifera MAFF 305830]|uniref:Uncharacterized protein n=1 Tax=Serendipita vermifera MAFF 305830 TaxID=933852 RepID=A0A0C2WN02_SERVB|nr:hypothetical protein M408DRAFT_9144 [Serendipita vermifera MAFF 305830]